MLAGFSEQLKRMLGVSSQDGASSLFDAAVGAAAPIAAVMATSTIGSIAASSLGGLVPLATAQIASQAIDRSR